MLATPDAVAARTSVRPGLLSDARAGLRAMAPQWLRNWREARFYARYGEVELHLLDILCDSERDAIDVGGNDGAYVHFLRHHCRVVHTYEPEPHLAEALRDKFELDNVVVHRVALSDRAGTIELHTPVVDGVPVTGCCTVSNDAASNYPATRSFSVPVERLDAIYRDEAGFIKIDVEGHQQAVLDGALQTIARCRPKMLVEIIERMSPGGLATARRMFEELHYGGWFVHQGQLRPIAEFSLETMQNKADIPPMRAHLSERGRFGKYLYNFIFLPAEEESRLVPRLGARLKRL